ncbi:PSD1 and planctomycete cytochrome C domain-containing protein [Aporhodopirellula aestuarii]|uniref:PSD1 and planctomycete cytochrome C domain-containing protein n=1 Tax=Aporhodopirellula aestuarii TaxID=2950107 RepID=A0ABT0U3K6_9BACT|nr:PSD1 and planctomycete cytochrome C domain-containing protein [Aporhodopirellula aestuarii]MCM2371244.1 PSD1 and planctomycete cytochrome C domain-containing protein [Aporhodopirellula aestuarii]
MERTHRRIPSQTHPSIDRFADVRLNRVCEHRMSPRSLPFRAPSPTACILVAFTLTGVVRAGERVDFNAEVRNLLSDKCFLCHGPDEGTREAGLRLDNRTSAIESSAIVPGHPDESELIARITSDDPDFVMPPPSTGRKVTAGEAEILRRWISQDASYDEHWAFVVARRPDLPEIQNADWARNEIDHFILAELESRSLSPSPPATPETLARRLSLDLVGLPPTITQLDEVVSANVPAAAIDALIDQLIDSPHFGERWARWWLDAARYSDSAGYEKDLPRSVWFYRDWVIDAMNRDLPYDQFVVEQIAGDLLPGATQSQRVATGFLRNSMTNEEGGVDPEQFRVEGMFDRMDAIGKAILGITTQCAQCHTHKYDPISHAEYYQMFAALNDFHEGCISVYTPEQADNRDTILDSIAKIEDRLRLGTPDWKEKVSAWADSLAAKQPTWTVMKPTTVPFGGQKFGMLEDGSIISESYAPSKASDDFSLTTHVGTITAVRLDALTHPQLPRGGPGRSVDGTGALSEFQLKIQPTAKDAEAIEVKFVRAISDVNPPRRDLKPRYRIKDAENDDRFVGPVEFAIDGDEKSAWTTDLDPGRNNQPRHAIFIPESPIVVDGEATLTFTMVQRHGGWNSDDNQNFLIARYRFSVTDSDTLPDTTINTSVLPVLSIPAEERSAAQWNQLFSEWRLTQDSLAKENSEIESLWKQYPETASQLVAVSKGAARETFVLDRGDFLSPLEPVKPEAPAFLHPMPSTNEPDRLRFARWLVSRDSPTTPRVIVNRIWQAYFGRGLVTTAEDFGYQSVAPSHPELLDFLARELIDSGWNLKHIHRLIVNSATYRQSSIAPPEAWSDDPSNEWLTRGPRYRVEAEMVRDIALSASGLLNTEVGGPSIYPPAPRFLFEPPTSYGPKMWTLDQDASQYRRSLYVHQYRSIPYPPLQVFDAPKGDAACVRRERSNTPLQALVMLNEPQFVDSARGLATRTLRDISPATQPEDCGPIQLDRERIVFAFRLCTSRTPDAEEIEILERLLDEQRAAFQADSDSAPNEELNQRLEQITGVPFASCLQLTGQTPAELAAWIVVSRTILNLDETITKS